MSIDVKVPNLPESVADATLVSWHKQPGDPVSRDENLVDLETDKVVLEIPAPADGTLGEILHGDGETVTTGDIIARIEEGGGAAKSTTKAESKAEEQPSEAPEEESAQAVDTENLSPAVRRLVQEHNLDVGKISSSGRGGRITKADVLAYMERKESAEKTPAKAPASEQPAAKPKLMT